MNSLLYFGFSLYSLVVRNINTFTVSDKELYTESYLKEAMVGLLLGDGTLVKKYHQAGTYFKYTQSINYGRKLYKFYFFNVL